MKWDSSCYFLLAYIITAGMRLLPLQWVGFLSMKIFSRTVRKTANKVIHAIPPE